MKIKSKLSKQVIGGLPLDVEVMNNGVTHVECRTPIVSLGQSITNRDVRRLTKNFKQSLYNNLNTQSLCKSTAYIVTIEVSPDTFNASGKAYLKLSVTLTGNGELDFLLTSPIKHLMGCSWCKFKILDEV